MLAALPISMLALVGWRLGCLDGRYRGCGDGRAGGVPCRLGRRILRAPHRLPVLDVLFVDERTGFAKPTNQDDRVALVLFALVSLLVIWLVQRVKAEGTEDRQTAIAARSAATALSVLETAAATQQRLSYSARKQIYEAIVHTVVGSQPRARRNADVERSGNG